ncbi:MAG: MYXO-CTERM sorting domain-containing protein, partial [Bradymonadaceae bacterium]
GPAGSGAHSGGCGCRQSPGKPTGSWLLLVVVIGGMYVRRRVSSVTSRCGSSAPPKCR